MRIYQRLRMAVCKKEEGGSGAVSSTGVGSGDGKGVIDAIAIGGSAPSGVVVVVTSVGLS